MTPNRWSKIKNVLNQRQPDLSILMEKVHKLHNFWAVVRTCDAVGISDTHVVVPEGGFRASAGLTQGSDKWVNVHRHRTFDEALTSVKNKKMKTYAAHFSDSAVDFRDVDYTIPCAIILGTEKFGVSEQAADAADEHIIIPMHGMVQSLNVSVAAALILYEAQRQRWSKNMYHQSRQARDVLETTAFEWGHPKIARYCKAQHCEYPPLDDDGNMIEAPPTHETQ